MSGFEWYPGKKRELEADISAALEMTAEAVRTDLVQSQTLPFAEASEKNLRRGVVPGQLQGSVYVDRTRSKQGRVSVVTSTPYARRLYFHPEYNYYRGTNAFAGGLWYEPYRAGERAKWVEETYAGLLARRRSG